MAIAFVNSGAVANITASYTVGGQANHLLVLTVVGGLNVDTVSAATYGGQSMTLVVKLNTNSNRYLYMFYLLNPPSGSNAFSITDGGNFNNGFAADYSGVKQSGQPDASGTNAATTTASISKAITTLANNCWLISATFVAAGATTLSAGANTTIRTKNGESSAIGDSNAPQTPPGSFSQAYSSSGTWDDAVIINASFAPAPGGTSGLQSKFW